MKKEAPLVSKEETYNEEDDIEILDVDNDLFADLNATSPED